MDLLKEECKETITGVVYFLVCIYVSMQEVPRCRGIYEIVFGRMKCRMFLYGIKLTNRNNLELILAGRQISSMHEALSS
ncbi:hypothetical protein M513_13810 [Trichuris suis]|uniref:Uncharacterized protein n=1 Tax=Trichuris suis TaxID=68888 RepID=A0A085LK18_9BILA|nr:hypothetical protein M513_13810 [Trichuris suis]